MVVKGSKKGKSAKGKITETLEPSSTNVGDNQNIAEQNSPLLSEKELKPPTLSSTPWDKDKKILGPAALRSKTSHPSALVMVCDAINSLGDKKGVSVQAIKTWMLGQYPEIGQSKVKFMVKKALDKGMKEGVLVRPKKSADMVGATGRFLVDNTKYKNSNKIKTDAARKMKTTKGDKTGKSLDEALPEEKLKPKKTNIAKNKERTFEAKSTKTKTVKPKTKQDMEISSDTETKIRKKLFDGGSKSDTEATPRPIKIKVKRRGKLQRTETLQKSEKINGENEGKSRKKKEPKKTATEKGRGKKT
ncbi:uncharacterized protein LOC143238928 [Tachypleus tridentatus]|uniref:uncharacterized protein LOC143238928 n=1 Tax=Tachypleus tridentatus TaxID=6853 RepID=UPI003FD09957